MNSSEQKVSRRSFLKASAFGAAALLLTDRTFRSISNSVRKSGTPVAWYRKGKIKTTYNYCDMCPWCCGIVVKSVDGKVYKIDGNPKDPKSRGMLCARGQGGVSALYDPDRLKQPMIRTGERGEGKFKTVSWEEALDYSAQKMLKIKEQYGPESIAFFGHTSGHFWMTDYLSQAFGSVNSAKPSVSMCTSPREEAALITFGQAIGNHEPVDWENTRCVVLLGTHIGEDARNTMMQDLARARDHGARLVVVDPRYSSVAMKADYWLPIKPGTDTALLLAWIHVLINERMYDADFIQKWTVGFDQLAAHVKAFTPEWAAPITDLAAEKIRATAHEMGRNRPQAVIVPGRHTIWYGNDTQRMRAVYIINALLGALGRPGGLYFNKPPFLDAVPHPPFAATSAAGG
ncbi:MAG TPA: molybdopterin-dependent oxidoreductase [Anaerolineaceae bacterium]